MSNHQYVVGIDFGTTNCTVAYVENNSDIHQLKKIHQFLIPQVKCVGEQGEYASLPSFVYFPLPEELKGRTLKMEWDESREYCVGVFARDRGIEVPTRLISSAKSWLCHSAIDRREPILPLDAEEASLKMSPAGACAELLKYIKESWDFKFKNAPFIEQQIFITVPASFDPSARQLIQEAAEWAGYPEVILLEEPQAAFYAWLHRHQDEWREILKVGDRVLVVDIGGGTTDFSLISVTSENGDLQLKREAVGSHLLLGGDNFDLALAYFAKDRLEKKGNVIDQWQFQSLVHTCRNAKEVLLGESPEESFDIIIQGRSSKLVGGTLKLTITKEEVDRLLVEGFFPLVGPEDRSPAERHLGLRQIGLPYAQDPRVSSQLAKFLSMTGEENSDTMEGFVLPSAVLFNGGTMKSFSFRKRVVELLNQWATTLKQPLVKELEKPDYDFGVSRGAVYYGLARNGKGIRIKSGTSHSYYIGVEEAVLAVPGMRPSVNAICVVPFGMEEGTENQLLDREFALLLGEVATFRFFSHGVPLLSDGTQPEVGTVVKRWEQELSELHPIEAKLDKKDGDGRTVKVKLKSRLTEVGTLELWCVAEGDRKWKLEFDIHRT